MDNRKFPIFAVLSVIVVVSLSALVSLFSPSNTGLLHTDVHRARMLEWPQFCESDCRFNAMKAINNGFPCPANPCTAENLNAYCKKECPKVAPVPHLPDS